MKEEPISANPIDDPYHVVASGSLTAEGTHVLKHGDSFTVVNLLGDITSVERGEQGLYHDGTRFLSGLRLSIEGQRPLLLSSSVAQDNVLLQVQLTNPELTWGSERAAVPYGTIHLERSKFLQHGVCFERLLLSNYGSMPVRFELQLDFASDFVDIFEVRGTPRLHRGEQTLPLVEGGSVGLGYVGLDGVTRQARLVFAPQPDLLVSSRAVFALTLESKQSRELYSWVQCLSSPVASSAKLAVVNPPTSFESAVSQVSNDMTSGERAQCDIFTSNEQFNDWINRAKADLQMLVTQTPQGPYPYAGVPWFSTPFGRDGIWTALEVLWCRPDIAQGVLLFLSTHQAVQHDLEADAQPGKILHELRGGEMAALREIPFGRYYGSIDSTLLYLMLAVRYYEATADRAVIETIWPNLLAAVDWLEHHGDIDGDGLIEYGRTSTDGLVQQGWKDSADSVFHRDGTLAPGPIALVEVQGYAFAALSGMARLAEHFGWSELATKWRAKAALLRERFDRLFWCEDLSSYALALDRDKLPCRVRTSNAGHCLYSGIVLPERAAVLASQLSSPDMFSGWGIRTLATTERRYNPMSYHNGSVWPHDNAIVAAGLAAYGQKDLAMQVLSGLFDATLFTHLHRLPELFCGFTRAPAQGPTLYPVACSPQAWASGAVFMLLQALMGLEVDALQQRVLLHHAVLPPYLHEVCVRNLRVGNATVDFRLIRHTYDVGVSVTRKEGSVDVIGVQ